MKTGEKELDLYYTSHPGQTITDRFVPDDPMSLIRGVPATFLINKAKKEADPKMLQSTAHNLSLSRVQATYRGTPGTVEGVALTRNLLYLQEAEDIWRSIEEASDLNRVMKYWMSGKFNPFKASHREAMESGGVRV